MAKGFRTRSAIRSRRRTKEIPDPKAMDVASKWRTKMPREPLNLSTAPMLVKMMEKEIQAEKRKQQAFFDLVERFREEKDPDVAKRLGDQLGRMVFGG